MGMCKPSNGIKKVFIPPHRGNIEKIEGETPNSRTDAYDEITGKLLQSRCYG